MPHCFFKHGFLIISVCLKRWTPKILHSDLFRLISFLAFSTVRYEVWDKPKQPCQFRSMMCGGHGGDSIAHFWKHLKTLSSYKYHDVLHNLSEEELTKAIPFAIHGDGAEFHRHSEYFVMSWTTALQTGSGNDNLLSRFPISLVAESHMSDDEDLWLLKNFVLEEFYSHVPTSPSKLHGLPGFSDFREQPPKKISIVVSRNGRHGKWCMIYWKMVHLRGLVKHDLCSIYCCAHGPTQGPTRSQQDPSGCGGMESKLGFARHLPQPWFLWRKVWQQHVQV